jgi:WD40 repeat protein
VILAHGLLVVDVAKGAGFMITTHAEPQSFALSGDESSLAVSDGSGRVTLWDTRKGALLRSFPLGGDPVALSPDGSTLVAGGQSLLAWDTRAGTELLHLPDTQAYDFGFADGGQEIVTASSTQVVTYDRSGKVKPGGGGAETGGTFATIVSPNGRFAASSAPDGHGLQVFEVHSWGPRQLVVIDACEEHVWPHFSQNGRLVFAKGGPRWVKGFEVGSFKPYASYHATGGRELAAFADDLTRVVVTRAGVDAAVVVVETKAEIKLEKAFGEEAGYSFSGDGRFIAGSAGKTVRVWDAKTAKVIHEIQG